MARIRTVKPTFWTDEEIASLSEPAMLLAIGLLNYSDDEGWFNANHLLIKAAIFPLRDPSKTIPRMLQELSDIGYIAIYPGHEGKQYGRVLNFSKHQRVDKPTPSEIKGLAIIQEQSKNPPGALPAGMEGKGSGKEKEDIGQQADHFPEFWKVYPRHVKKKTAGEIWKRKNLNGLADILIEDVATRKKQDHRWLQGFIPDPTTYLNQERWNDELDTSKPAGGNGKPDWAKIPMEDTKLWDWAKQHSYSNPGNLDYYQYRKKLQAEVEARLNQ